jgi:xanthine dehydrogenase accessory factor
MPLRAQAAAWLQADTPAVLVEVSAARGSVPRERGTRMLVAAGATAGTIGGGHLELQAIARARAMLADAGGGTQSAHFPLGPALGQCCGGAVTLSFCRLDAAALAAWPQTGPLFHLQLYGAGHVGRAIALALAPLNVSVDWIDERDDEFPVTFFDHDSAAWPAHIRKVCVDSVEAEVGEAPANAFYLVLTHRHDLDLRITQAILQRGDFAFFGLIGSKTKRQSFVHRLQERGFVADRIARMTCPIGVEGIVGKEPEVIAASVVAQLLQQASRAPTAPSQEFGIAQAGSLRHDPQRPRLQAETP